MLTAPALLLPLLTSTAGGTAPHASAQTPQVPASDKRLTFPVATRLVQVSVVVHDKDGAPVRGLTAADFQLFEEGKEQAIESFSVESEPAAAAVAAASAAPAPAGPEVEFNNQRHGRGGVTVILLDRLNTAWEDQTYAKNQIVKFLGQIQPNDRVGLYLLESRSVRVLHDFTTDVASLLRALARHRGRTSGELAASEERAFETGDTEMDVFLGETARIVNAAFLRRRAETTCDALVAVANHLSGVRGRKNLVWVSSSFPLTFDDPIARGSPQGLSTGTVSADVERATRALSDAGIAVYPVDARGLVGAFTVNPASIPSTPDSGRTMRGAFATMATVTPNIDTSRTIAENTGGRAFHSTNDISGAIRRAVDDARVTYLLGYSPTHGKWNGRFREIKVKVKKPGVEVRHRRGYLAFALPEHDKGKTGQVLTQTLQNPLEATGIAVAVRVERTEGSLGREVNLAIRMDPRPITLERKGENWQGTIALIVAQSNAEGKVFKAFDGNIDLPLTQEMRDRLLNEGLVLNKKVTLRDDVHQLHVVVSDPPTGAVGSLIIPADKPRAAAGR